jgi:hypothetical protein
VPLKVGQRHVGSPLSGVTVEDVRIYARALAESEATSLANAALFAALIAAPVEKRDAANVESLYGWWLTNVDDEGSDSSPSATPSPASGAISNLAGRSPM